MPTFADTDDLTLRRKEIDYNDKNMIEIDRPIQDALFNEKSSPLRKDELRTDKNVVNLRL